MVIILLFLLIFLLLITVIFDLYSTSVQQYIDKGFTINYYPYSYWVNIVTLSNVILQMHFDCYE
ncbi:hypothetical protein JF50_20225 [Pseudoalteromonas luteoviolacea]|uniref:Uncharacterized protein n=1 Tax=Pseudoalteromonas luteoviolacea TaxID=43657 RepID=A0A0C1Q4Q1_9GAMM|nr:hypothetical protein JF50_20225 [Pseudoalteromonas luteoviolacea]